MCNSGYFLFYVDGLGTSYARSFLSWSLIKQQNTFFCNTFILKFERMYLPEMHVDMT